MELIQTESNDKQQSSLLSMSLKGPLKEQMADYLNASINEVQSYELRQKNLMAINTIEFIDGQLIQIESALRDSETALKEFRSENLIVDLSSESAQMLEYFIELEQERAALNLQRSFYKYVIDFLQSKNNFEINISISDEREKLLDTGGGLLKMANFFSDGNPFFVHNVDILSNIDLKKMYDTHIKSNAVESLSTRHRATSRYLLFNKKNKLFGWMNIKTGKMILCKKRKGKLNLRAFSGIHVISPDIFDAMPDNKNAFSIIDVYLAAAAYQKIVEYPHDTDIWMDVGKIENIDQAKKVLKEILVTE